VLEWHGDNYEQDYLTDLIGRKALNFLADYEGENPFLMVLATPSPHAPFTPAPQHKTAFEDKARITLAMDSAAQCEIFLKIKMFQIPFITYVCQ
jgi:hypothetical protein